MCVTSLSITWPTFLGSKFTQVLMILFTFPRRWHRSWFRLVGWLDGKLKAVPNDWWKLSWYHQVFFLDWRFEWGMVACIIFRILLSSDKCHNQRFHWGKLPWLNPGVAGRSLTGLRWFAAIDVRDTQAVRSESERKSD